jgi:hypothetical protein
MVANADLFQQQGTAAMSPSSLKWQMVTNHRNLFYMLAAGMIMPPSGFGGKYYEDPLSCFPGWIPLFPGRVPLEAIRQSAQEKKHLIPCIMELELDKVRGTAKAVRHDGGVTDIRFPDDVVGDEAFVLLPAPLPVTWISDVLFESKNDKGACEKDANDFDNVALDNLSLKSLKSAFSKATSIPWPQTPQGIDKRDVSLAKPLAAGGILAILSHLGNTGDLAISAAAAAFERNEYRGDLSKHQILAALGNWLRGDEIGSEYGASAELYWSLVDRLIDARDEKTKSAAIDVILGSLVESGKELEGSAKSGVDKLIADLQGIVGLGEYSVTELLERHTKPLPRALILLFLRESCEELLDFHHELLNEYDYVAAAILFAVRDTWLSLPSVFRRVKGLTEACCHEMAAMSLAISDSGLDLGEAPARPKSLRELLREQPWRADQSKAALLLATKCGWACIRTRVSLGKGEYRLEVDGRGVHLIFEGEPKGVRTEADYDSVLNNLTSASIPEAVEASVRALLKAE